MTDPRPLILDRLDALDWNRSDLARESGVSVRLVSDFFAGREIKSDNLMAILDAVGITLAMPRRAKSKAVQLVAGAPNQ